MTLILFGVAAAFCCAGFMTLALCRAASARDKAHQEAWERHHRKIEMETDYYEEHA